MPWCPSCDEVFPEGPACPRCRTRLVDRERGAMGEDLQSVPELPMIKVSRRDRRALERMSGPKAPSSRVLAAAVAALVFAVGFLVGRLGSLEQAGPSVRALPAAQGLMPFAVDGSATYLLWTNEPLATLAVHNVYSGDVVPRARLSPPVEVSDDTRTRLAVHGRSVALVVADDERSFVAFAAAGQPPHGWVPGVEAAWTSADELLVREAGGAVAKWSVGPEGLRSRGWGEAERLFQTAQGAVVLRDGRLIAASGRAVGGAVPDGAEVLATDGKRALLDTGRILLWDGSESVPVRVQGSRALAASFAADGEVVAVVLRNGDDLMVAVVDTRGNAAIKPLGTKVQSCTPAVSWDRAGRWLYVGAGDGVLYAVEAAGGHVEHVRTQSIGCGLAWLDER